MGVVTIADAWPSSAVRGDGVRSGHRRGPAGPTGRGQGHHAATACRGRAVAGCCRTELTLAREGCNPPSSALAREGCNLAEQHPCLLDQVTRDGSALMPA
jgi:hypothetical protein